MPHPERGLSMDGERYLRHQQSSSSDQGFRASIPMWDSSDPERAPPPLPLNPQSPKMSSRAGTSSTIASAHAALSERARESAFMPPSNKRHKESHEKAGMSGRTGSHRRLQSSSVRDISMMLESNTGPNVTSTSRSPERPQYRPTTPPPQPSMRDMREREIHFENRAYDNRQADDSAPALSSSITPIFRPQVRRPATQGSILGENTPPQSSTMLALQNMSSGSPTKDSGEPTLSSISNGQRLAPTLENLSAQLAALTNIAQNLQREMGALSRRSRDNATDLLSLKEATNTRDEDIRKSLRDLLGNINDQAARLTQRDSFGGYFIDNKAHTTSPTSGRTFNIPRMGSPKSFAESIDRASISTPSLVGGENSSIALILDRILRGLGTRDGHESLVSILSDVSDRLAGLATLTKIEELVSCIRSQSETAIVPLHAGNGYMPRRLSIDETTIDLDASSPMGQRLLKDGDARDARSTSESHGRGVNILNEDVINIIRSVKDSVAQSGGLTAEVKALVRELRGEVLGMGRELGKRLENVGRRGVEDTDSTSSASKDEVSRVIDEGLEQMKEQLNHVLREHRRQAASAEKHKNVVDYQEVYNALRNALKDNETVKGVPDLNRDDVMEAVREAWENYKPEIEVQQIGLERDEVLACLKQGFQEYESRHQSPPGASRDEVFTAVVEGLKHFVPPQVETPVSLSRNEIMDAVRECLEEFEFPLAPSAGGDLTREDMIHAVKEGLSDLDLSRSKALVPAGHSDNEIIERLHDLMDTLKLEFRIVSQNNKENATKGGLDRLRVALEGHIDRVADPAGREAFMDSLLKTLEGFKAEVSTLVTEANSKSREQLQTELEGLRDIVNSSMVPALPNMANINTDEILETLRNGLSSLHKEVMRSRPETTEILDALNEGLNDIRAVLEKISNKPGDLTANDEILDALNDGLKSVKSEIETMRDTSNDRAVTAWRDPSGDMALVAADAIKHDDIKNLEILVTELRSAVDTIEPKERALYKSDVARLEEMVRGLGESVEEIKTLWRSAPAPAAESKPTQDPVADQGATESGNKVTREATAKSSESTASTSDLPSREDVEAIETIVRNTRSRLDDFFDGEQTVRKEHIDNVEALLLDTRETMRSLNAQMETQMGAIPLLSHKDDVSSLATLLTKLSESVDEVKGSIEKDRESPERITKHDVESVEAVALEIKSAVEGLASMDLSAISTKEDFSKLEAILREAKQTFDAYNDTISKASTERQVEMSGVGDGVVEVKAFLEELRLELRTKFEAGATGADALRGLMEAMEGRMSKNETVGADVKEMLELMKGEFEISKEALGGSRIEANEKLEQATENIRSRIDEKVSELLARHEKLYSMMDEKAQAAEARDVVTEAAITSNRNVTEEVKLFIDTLGCTVTESLERMEEASKTVFTKVEELTARSDEQHSERKMEHQKTREQVKETLGAVESLQGGVSEVQPRILETVKSILQLVDDHFEHSRTSAMDLQGRMEAQPTSEALQAMIPQPEKYDDSAVREKLDSLIETRYDDSEVQGKLDKIAAHGETAAEALAHLQTLDKVHDSVIKSAAELSDFIAAQLQHEATERDDFEKRLHETKETLGKAQTEKDAVELTVLRLRDEEEQLRQSIHSLRIENESLIKQRTRLTGDVSSLETALRIRKEELYEMESRAEGLERRILNGIMDHSRVLLFGKAGKNGTEAMNRKRVRRPATEGGGYEVEDEEEEGDRGIGKIGGSLRSSSRPDVAMSLSSGMLAAGGQGGAGRRIVSLSQMKDKQNSPKIKRSQSVRTNRFGNSHRGRSWAGPGEGGALGEDGRETMSVGGGMEEILEVDTSYISQTRDEPPVDDSYGEEEGEGDEGGEYEEGEEGEEDEEDGEEEEGEGERGDGHGHGHGHGHGEMSGMADEEIDEDDMEEEIDEDGCESEEMLRRVSDGTTVVKKHEEGSDGSVYEESIDGDDDDDAVLVD